MDTSPPADHDTLPPSMDPAIPDQIVEPPRDFFGILTRLGPGLIIAGSIVGSGELIATTKTGAQAGIALLWLIVIGCLIKVFVQIELGRYTISHGETTLAALDQVPGPRLRVNWIIWYWLLMMVAGIGQLGGIVGGVGQSMALSVPILGDYAEAIRLPETREIQRFIEWEDDRKSGGHKLAALPEEKRVRIVRGHEVVREQLQSLGTRGEEIVELVRHGGKIDDPWTYDDKIWAAVTSIVTAGLLFWGRYNLIQTLSTVLVVGFTFITIGNVVSLQSTPEWRLSGREILRGLMFELPGPGEGLNPLATALAAFGIIGVGATELIAYPYWCLEKGYAKFAGPRSANAGWAARAEGWIQVMHYDAFLSMVIYTTATLAFYWTGVAVLHREGRDPDGMRMVSTLATAYVPVFGAYARWLFLLGAFAVLYSTFLVAIAGHARTFTDSLKLYGLLDPHNPRRHDQSVAAFSAALPFVCLAIFASGLKPDALILLSGVMQSIMLPMLAGAAMYFRYRRTDSRLCRKGLWDVALVISSLGLLVAGVWGASGALAEVVKYFGVQN